MTSKILSTSIQNGIQNSCKKTYDPNLGGSNFNNGSGETQNQNNFRQKPTPVLGLQWKDGVANNTNQPNPFPIYITKNQKIKA